MLCLSVSQPNEEEALAEIQQFQHQVELIELRLDFFPSLNIEKLRQLRTCCQKPLICTLRTHHEGGQYTKDDQQYHRDLRLIAEIKPDYIDIEYQRAIGLNIPMILSYHDLSDAPLDLIDLAQKMQKTHAAYYKIAKRTNQRSQALELLCQRKALPENFTVIPIEEHEEGLRLAGTLAGNALNYTYVNRSTALGQIPLSLFHERYSHISSQTKLFALLGNPVSQSPSHRVHNEYFRSLELNAIYLKLLLNHDNLSEFLQAARLFPIQGLSVTIPFKESIIPHLDEIDDEAKAIGAVNTLVYQQGKYLGYNTDGKGALDVIELYTPVLNQRMLILGSGGSARAIAYEALKRKAQVTIIARRIEKAQQIAKAFNCDYATWDDLDNSEYDILINATPLKLPCSVFKRGTYVMDLTPREGMTPFLKAAKEARAIPISGYEMFIKQGAYQCELWFPPLG